MSAATVASDLAALGADEQRVIAHVLGHLAGRDGSATEQLERLDADELAFVSAVVARVGRGARTYGTLELDTDPRDMLWEALAELLDAAFYVAAQAERDGSGPRRVPLSRVVDLGMLLQRMTSAPGG